ncbi:MAG: hypothetical protein KF687_03405 [Cyclobacteriaceae bacterium]|nr:hypothetical protein [Cyclobacteriaceae bacterium]
MKAEVRKNLTTYFILLIIVLIGIYYGRSIAGDYRFLRVWDFSNLMIMAIGIPFLFFQSQARLPEFWSSFVSSKTRIVVPLVIGMVFGILDVFVFKVIIHPEPYTELPPFLQPFPYSVFLYLSGAFEVEVFYRMIPLTIIMVAGSWFKEGKHYSSIFWIALLLTSLREPIEQLPDGNLTLVLYSLLTGFAMNFLQGIYYSKAGFIASLFLRLGHYLIWHILLGVFVEYVELL